ncbi:MAG: TolC family protein, partial [Steroidobacteraceae bacterium]
LAALRLPADLPVSLPARLVRQRPDVLAAEAQLHAASAQVGVSIADLLPQVSITGTAGGASTAIQSLFAAGNAFWTAGASLSQTLFAGGALWHRERAARAALDEAGAQYRAVVLTACEQVADTLRALELDADAVGASARAAQAAADTLAATRRNVELGSASYLALLAAEQAGQQAALALAQARAGRLADTAALFQALGGGWWNAPGEPAARR